MTQLECPSFRRAAGTLLFALLLCSPVAAGEGGMTSSDLLRLQSVGQAVASPVGPEIAYTLSIPRDPFVEDNGPARRELHVIDAEGESRRYVGGDVRVSNLDWHMESTGPAISFLAKREGDADTVLYSIPLSGGEPRRVAVLDGGVSDYAWSPVSGGLALLGEGPTDDEEAEELEDMGFNQKVFEESWRPSRVFLTTVGPEVKDPQPLAVEGSVRDMSWSPDGEHLLLKVAPTSFIDDSYLETRLRVVRVKDGEVVAKIENPGKLGAMGWSPDGQHIAYISGAHRNDPREGRLMLVPLAGGEPKDLLPGLEGHVQRLLFEDESTLLFVSAEGTGTRVGSINLETGRDRTLVDAGKLVIGGLGQTAEGGFVLVGSTPSHPDEVFRTAPLSRKPKRLTNSNPWLDERRLGTQEVVRYSARDGLEIEGLLIRPVDEKPEGGHPLIMVVHGGPESHYSNGWRTSANEPGQIAAARGFAVFYPNYRASTGRGVEFSMMDHGDPAGAEFDDLVDGVDHLVKSGLVDTSKVGIMGGSYGGYATGWGATYYSERYAAAVMSVGISEKVAALGTSDIPVELYDSHLRKWPWEAWDLYRERSPLYHVEKARTPLLLLHGEEDARVHPSQSMMLFRFLKLLDKTPVRLVLYPGEGHGNRKSAARMDTHLRTMRWFEHYLMGPGGEKPVKDLDYEALLED